MRTIIIGAGSDLGTHIDGANLGPVQLLNDIKSFYQGETILLERDHEIIKSRNLSDRRKNEYELNRYNTTLYEKEVEMKSDEDSFVITLGNGLGHNWWCVLFPPLCLLDEQNNLDNIEYDFYATKLINKYK